MTDILQPRVLFLEGMERHEQTMSISAHAIGQTLVSRGIDEREALAFDVALVPSDSAYILGQYVRNTKEREVTTTSGETTALKTRAIELHVSPDAQPARSVTKFSLLHEAGHMYRDLIGCAPDTISYYDPVYLNKVKRIGKIGTAVFGITAATFVATEGIDAEPFRTIMNAATLAIGGPAGLCIPAAAMPFGVAWATSREEWRAHIFALRHWRADVVGAALPTDN